MNDANDVWKRIVVSTSDDSKTIRDQFVAARAGKPSGANPQGDINVMTINAGTLMSPSIKSSMAAVYGGLGASGPASSGRADMESESMRQIADFVNSNKSIIISGIAKDGMYTFRLGFVDFRLEVNKVGSNYIDDLSISLSESMKGNRVSRIVAFNEVIDQSLTEIVTREIVGMMAEIAVFMRLAEG